MRQIAKYEIEKLKKKNLYPLVMTVLSDNLENYVFPQIKLNWDKPENEIDTPSSVMLLDGDILYSIQNHQMYANVFIWLPKFSEQYIPPKSEIEKTLNKLNIYDQVIWFNDWCYLPPCAKDLKEKIKDWINEDKTIAEIKEKTSLLTGLEEKEVKNLLTSHYLLAGTTELEEFYPK